MKLSLPLCRQSELHFPIRVNLVDFIKDEIIISHIFFKFNIKSQIAITFPHRVDKPIDTMTDCKNGSYILLIQIPFQNIAIFYLVSSALYFVSHVPLTSLIPKNKALTIQSHIIAIHTTITPISIYFPKT